MAEERDHAEAKPDSLYKTDEEIARLVGVGVDKWRAIVAVLEPKGLPRRDPLFCGRRYWPSVRAYLDRRNYLHVEPRIFEMEENLEKPTIRVRSPETV